MDGVTAHDLPPKKTSRITTAATAAVTPSAARATVAEANAVQHDRLKLTAISSPPAPELAQERRRRRGVVRALDIATDFRI